MKMQQEKNLSSQCHVKTMIELLCFLFVHHVWEKSMSHAMEDVVRHRKGTKKDEMLDIMRWSNLGYPCSVIVTDAVSDILEKFDNKY